MNRIETVKQCPIKSFISDQIDLSKFSSGTFIKEDFGELLPSQADFYTEAFEAKIRYGGKNKNISRSPDARFKSRELIEFLDGSRPPILFFEPQDAASLLTPDSDITVSHEKNEKLEKWEFTLNPQRHEVSRDLFAPNRKQTITLTRGDPGEYARQNPYLAVGFPAKYDGNNVIFYPHIMMTYGDSYPREELEMQMMKLLNLNEHVVPRQLEFTVKKTPKEYTLNKKLKIVKRSSYFVEISLKEETPEKKEEIKPAKPHKILLFWRKH